MAVDSGIGHSFGSVLGDDCSRAWEAAVRNIHIGIESAVDQACTADILAVSARQEYRRGRMVGAL